MAEDEVEKGEKSKMLVRCQAQEMKRMVTSSTAGRNLGELVWVRGGDSHGELPCRYPKLYHIASVSCQIEHAVNMFSPN